MCGLWVGLWRLLTHSSRNRVGVTTPAHFLCRQLPQAAPYLTDRGETSRSCPEAPKGEGRLKGTTASSASFLPLVSEG